MDEPTFARIRSLSFRRRDDSVIEERALRFKYYPIGCRPSSFEKFDESRESSLRPSIGPALYQLFALSRFG